jgi:hypothetical protein
MAMGGGGTGVEGVNGGRWTLSGERWAQGLWGAGRWVL